MLPKLALPPAEFPAGHMTRTMLLDGIIFIVGLALTVTPFAAGWYPGDIDTTTHVAIGPLIFTPALFRMLVAYASLWIEVVEIALGVLVLLLPTFMHMRWHAAYNTGHLAAGAIIIVAAAISAVLTLPYTKKSA